MTLGRAVSAAMKEVGYTQTRACELLGMRQTGVSKMLTINDSTRITGLLKILEIIGYELVVRPVKSGRKEENCFVVTVDRKEDYIAIGEEKITEWMDKELERLGTWFDGFEVSVEIKKSEYYVVMSSYVMASRRAVKHPSGGQVVVMKCTSKSDAGGKKSALYKKLKKNYEVTMAM